MEGKNDMNKKGNSNAINVRYLNGFASSKLCDVELAMAIVSQWLLFLLLFLLMFFALVLSLSCSVMIPVWLFVNFLESVHGLLSVFPLIIDFLESELG